MGLEDRCLDSNCPPLRRFLKPESTVLDIGCGPGVIAIDVAREVGEGHVTGLDLIPDRVESAIARAAEEGVHNVEFLQGDALALPLEDDSFDLVYSTFALEHIADRVTALREMKRVAKPNGLVICVALDISTAVFYPPCPSMEAIYRGWARLPETPNPDTVDPGLGRRMYSLGVEAGFGSVEIELFGIPNFMATSAQPENVHKTFVQARHHAGKDHKMFKRLVEAGFLSIDLSDRAHVELEAWRSHPGAFFSWGTGVLLVGRI
jgi:SAM-dependent methyltransferase